MLCSKCHKNQAVLFFEKDPNSKELEGLCVSCAKEQGIDPEDTLARQREILSKNTNIDDMKQQFETIFKDFAENMNFDDISKIDGAITFGPDDLNEGSDGIDGPRIAGAAIPLGSIFSNVFGGGNNAQNFDAQGNSRKKVKVEKKKTQKQSKKKKYLDTFGTNLTNKAKNNELDMIIGRDKEIQRIIQILNRRSKNNPCLIGEPGVGKTAIAQGLAIKIANQNVPAKLLNKEVYLLDMTAVIAGTQFRGQFESRMKGIIDECKQL